VVRSIRRVRIACLATIFAADYVILRRKPRWLTIGLLDEPAHVATAILLRRYLSAARDVALEPGLPRFGSRHVKLPYGAYALLILATAYSRSRPC
jgi:hypothetical protein